MRSRRISHRLREAHFTVLLVTALLAIAACQTAPVQEMSDARQAIAVAQEAGAAELAAAELKQALEFLRSAERFLNERQYSFARRDAVQAKAKALDALQRSESNEEESP